MIVHWEDLELYTSKLMFWVFPVLFYINSDVPLVGCLEQEGLQDDDHVLCPQPGSEQGDIMDAQSHLLDPEFNNCVMLVGF